MDLTDSFKLFLISCFLAITICPVICQNTSESSDESISSTKGYSSSVDHITLRSVTVIFNEGLSTPPSSFSYIDPYLRPEFWPDGQPQLTATGKKQLYEAGEWFRKRYHNFLTDSPREVYARSSDKDNNIEGSSVLLHGAYKACGRWRYANTDFLPIAIHSVPTEDDCMLNIHCKCPKVTQVIVDVINSPEALKLKEEFSSVLKLVETKTRLTNFFSQVDYIETVLVQAVYLKTPVPSWITPGVIEEFTELSDGFHSMATAYPGMLKLMAGPFYSELIDKLRTTVNTTSRSSPSQKPKFLLYSTANPIFSSVVYHLTGVNGVIPPPATFFIIELFEEPGSSFFIKFYYWKSTLNRQPELLSANFTLSSSLSATSPSLDDLIAHIQGLTEPNWKAYCGLCDSNDSGPDTLSLVLIIILCIVFASVIFTVVMIVKRSRSGYVVFK